MWWIKLKVRWKEVNIPAGSRRTNTRPHTNNSTYFCHDHILLCWGISMCTRNVDLSLTFSLLPPISPKKYSVSKRLYTSVMRMVHQIDDDDGAGYDKEMVVLMLHCSDPCAMTCAAVRSCVSCAANASSSQHATINSQHIMIHVCIHLALENLKTRIPSFPSSLLGWISSPHYPKKFYKKHSY